MPARNSLRAIAPSNSGKVAISDQKIVIAIR